MARLPTVAIIGRPNTGKSTLFNRLNGRRKAIVSDIPGTTRDHIAAKVETDTADYLLIDTGGMGGGTEDHELEDDVHRQSLLALENADLILLTIDSTQEMTSNDFEVIELLRKNRKRHVPVILVLTKCDNPEMIDSLLPEYYQLGVTDIIIAVSAPHNRGIDDLQRSIGEQLSLLHFGKQATGDEAVTKVAIIGKPNVGKSSLVNAFMSETQRKQSPLLVSDIAGTTRDATDTIIRFHEREYLFVDTAGIKRPGKTDDGIETYAYLRSIRALQEADIAVLIVDVTQPMSKLDKRVAGMAVEEGKGLIVLLNKCDLLSGDTKMEAIAHAKGELAFCRFGLFLPVSAKTKEGLLKIFDMIETCKRNRERRIPDKELHRWYTDSVHNQPMAELAKSKHITQANEVPPTFVIFVKNPKKVQISQLRYLENSLRRTFAFEGAPIRWVSKGQR